MHKTAAHNAVGVTAPAQDVPKEFETLRARFALAGHQLFMLDPASGSGGFLVSRWGHCRSLATYSDAERFLAQVSGGAQ